MADELLGAIEALKNKALSQVEALKAVPEMTELIKIHSALNTLEGLCGNEKTALAELFGLDRPTSEEKKPSIVKVGEYFGKKPLEAAKLFLKMRGRPATLEEIVENLAIGSCDVKSKEELRVSLGRSTFEVARLNDNTFDLLERYPDVMNQRLAAARKRPANNGGSQEPSAPTSNSEPETAVASGTESV